MGNTYVDTIRIALRIHMYCHLSETCTYNSMCEGAHSCIQVSCNIHNLHVCTMYFQNYAVATSFGKPALFHCERAGASK